MNITRDKENPEPENRSPESSTKSVPQEHAAEDALLTNPYIKADSEQYAVCDAIAGPQRPLVPPPPAPPFTASHQELICALISYIAAYCYIEFFSRFELVHTVRMVWMVRLCLLAVAAFIVFATEYLNKKRTDKARTAMDEDTAKVVSSANDMQHKGTNHRESLIWLVCFLLCLTGFLRHFAPYILIPPVQPDEYIIFETWREGAWDSSQTLLFIHIFAVWWILARSDALADGRSGHLLPLDALNGFIVLPFGGFFLRVRIWLWGIREASRGKSRHISTFTWQLAAAAAVCLGLFITALRLLSRADIRFDSLLESLRDIFRFEPDHEIVIHFLFSLPVGAWLFGLIDGSIRRSHEKTETQKASVLRALDGLRGIPTCFWIAVASLFSMIYAVFYVLQASYLFGAFTGTLPEGFIVSQYAREGFFELCRVMTVNFALLWLVTRMTRASDTRSRTLRIICLVLLGESALFAVIALSKLGLYISVFGFTPLRLQSSWLVCTLLAGCILWAWSLLTERPAFRKWMIFGAVTLSLLCLY